MIAGQFGEAADYFHQSSDAYAEHGDGAASRMSRVLRALALVELGERDRAKHLLAMTGQEAEREEDDQALLASLSGLTEVAMGEDDYQQALHFVDTALTQAEERDVSLGAWQAKLLKLEVILGAEGILAFDQAIEQTALPEGLRVRELDEVRYLGLSALSKVYRGNLGVGTTDGAEAVRRLVNLGKPSIAIRLLGWISERFEDAGEHDIAIQFADKAAVVALAVGNLPVAISALSHTSRLFVQSDRPAEAIEVLERAIGEAQRVGSVVELESLLRSALSIERALDYPRLVVHRLLRLAEVVSALYGIERKQECLVEALTVAVAGHVGDARQIAESVVAHLSRDALDRMDDKQLLRLAKTLGGADQFEVAQGFVMARAQDYVSQGRTRRAAEMVAEFAEIAWSQGRADFTESAYAMAIVLGERMNLLETETWRQRLDSVLYD